MAILVESGKLGVIEAKEGESVPYHEAAVIYQLSASFSLRFDVLNFNDFVIKALIFNWVIFFFNNCKLFLEVIQSPRIRSIEFLRLG